MQITYTTSVEEIMRLCPPCSCKQCQHGCTMGSGVMVADDVTLLAKFMKLSKLDLSKKYLEKITLFEHSFYRPKLIRHEKPYGKCIFFKDELCSIHEAKPLQCKIAMGCSVHGEDLMVWFMLHHVIDFTDSSSVKAYKSYIDSGGKVLAGATIEEIIPDVKIRELLLH